MIALLKTFSSKWKPANRVEQTLVTKSTVSRCLFLKGVRLIEVSISPSSLRTGQQHVSPNNINMERFTHVASIYANFWTKRKHLHDKRVQPPEDTLGTPTWPPFHCFGTPIWPSWRHVKTLYSIKNTRLWELRKWSFFNQFYKPKNIVEVSLEMCLWI